MFVLYFCFYKYNRVFHNELKTLLAYYFFQMVSYDIWSRIPGASPSVAGRISHLRAGYLWIHFIWGIKFNILIHRFLSKIQVLCLIYWRQFFINLWMKFLWHNLFNFVHSCLSCKDKPKKSLEMRTKNKMIKVYL